MILTVPVDDGRDFPSLGPQIVMWMEKNLVFGPGDLRGEPLRLDQEQQAFIWRMYEHYPKGHRRAGRRRFQRCALSLAKGLRKTELAAFIAAAELHQDAPVRFNGWKGKKLATGKGVKDPVVIMVATTEGQSDQGAYEALKSILENGPLAKDFDIGLERIMRLDGAGKAISVAGSPDARDGARTTFQIFDETHRQTSERNRHAHQTMMANMPKRKIADTWALEITTAPEPGAGSIAESTMDYAKLVVDGAITDAGLFFYHRQASDHHDLKTEAGAREAVIEASGPAAEWRDIDAVVNQWKDPTTDRSYWERVWCNRLVKGATQAFDVNKWRMLVRRKDVQAGAIIVAGFDGAKFRDSTALVATEVATGYQWLAGLWSCPPGAGTTERPWEVPTEEVTAAVRSLFETYLVWAMYADPPYWEEPLAQWAGAPWSQPLPALGDAWKSERIVKYLTNRYTLMASSVSAYDTAIRNGTLTHDGDARFESHIGNSRKQDTSQRDADGRALWVIKKDRPDSPFKVDAAVAGVLSWQARVHALAHGVTAGKKKSIYASRGAPAVVTAAGIIPIDPRHVLVSPSERDRSDPLDTCTTLVL